MPPIAERISPIVGLVNISEKSHPLPHKTNDPNKHAKAATIDVIVGFSLTKINIINGTAIQDILSKKVFFAGVVVSNPINWNKYAAPRKRPAGMHIR